MTADHGTGPADATPAVDIDDVARPQRPIQRVQHANHPDLRRNRSIRDRNTPVNQRANLKGGPATNQGDVRFQTVFGFFSEVYETGDARFQ